MEKIIIIDFGSQYTQLITRRIGEANVFSEIYPHSITFEKIKELAPSGIILSGGPMSVYDEDAPDIDERIINYGVPVLGICYGLQIICKKAGGLVEPAKDREYGKAVLEITEDSRLFKDVSPKTTVWMSHGDYLTKFPEGFIITAVSEHSPICALENTAKQIYGVQFHPEVMHSTEGHKIISNFLFNICNCKGEWSPANFIKRSAENIKEITGSNNVICALSGGVDSTVAAVLVKKAIGERLHCIHIDNGLMRKDESKKIKKLFDEQLHLNVKYVDASELFLSRLNGVSDPEKKRKIIGAAFIEIFEKEARKIENAKFLVQGTLYPDVIESVSVKGASVTIKSHHNVGGLTEKMDLKLI